MDYLQPRELAQKMVEAGEEKLFMSTKDTLIRSIGAGALLTLAAFFALTVITKTGSLLTGAILFPIGFIMLNMLKFDLITGVFTLSPLPVINGREGCTWAKVFRNWSIVFCGNFIGSLFVVFLASFSVRYGYSGETSEIFPAFHKLLSKVGEGRTLGFEKWGIAGWFTCFVRGILCNWMVSMGVIGAIYARSTIGKFFCMWAPIMCFFFMVFEHAVVNMFLFPFAMTMGADFTLVDFFLWNEIPTLLGNFVGGFCLVGLPIYLTHFKVEKKAPQV
ncbi:formate/nitrite transporter family protein [Rubritalea profundi]|uniref:Formate transporter n=1 Tax=Rubritalea profundi TaxID=1658618 RepID=A0A2S7U6I5_9BACT|nr:formate/nitrite transporter family protein [Rubritalea profundi]PQJ30160.1 formate transporter [Rubritalea profundi]